MKSLPGNELVEIQEDVFNLQKFAEKFGEFLLVSLFEDGARIGETLFQLSRDGRKAPKPRGLTAEQIAVMQRESENIDREFRSIETTYGVDHLDLVVALGYVSKLLGNVRVVRYLAQQHPDIFREFQKCMEYHQSA